MLHLLGGLTALSSAAIVSGLLNLHSGGTLRYVFPISMGRPSPKGLYASRVVGCHHDHRYSDCLVAAGGASSTRVRTAIAVYEQPETACVGLAQLPCGVQCVPARRTRRVGRIVGRHHSALPRANRALRHHLVGKWRFFEQRSSQSGSAEFGYGAGRRFPLSVPTGADVRFSDDP